MRPKSLSAEIISADARPDFAMPLREAARRAGAGSPFCIILTFKVFLSFASGCQRAPRRGSGGENSGMVGAPGLEPGTSSLSEKRSNQLSYAPAGTLVEPKGLEPTTSCLQSRRSTS